MEREADDDWKCPECEGTNFKRWELPHPLMLHWVLNPGLAFNELVLGQRIPKLQLICQDCSGSVVERGYQPCPSCRMLYPSRSCGGWRSFGSWRGVACPACGEPIPCLWNLTSLVILVVTSPLWGFPYLAFFRNRPRKPICELEGDGRPPEPKPVTRKTWVVMGVAWGAFMWVFMSLFIIWMSRDHDVFPWKEILGTLPIWAVGGFAFGFFMWFLLGRKKSAAFGESAAPTGTENEGDQ